MQWILALVGLVVGAGVAETGWFGAAVGFVAGWVLAGQSRLRSRIEQVETQLTQLRARGTVGTREDTVAPTPVRPVAWSVGPAASASAAADRDPDMPAVARSAADAMASEPQPVSHTTSEPLVPAAPEEPVGPTWFDNGVAMVKRWFTEGNVPVKIGVLVLFAGVAAALKFASDQGFLNAPIEVRLALIAAGAGAGLALGWRERLRKRVFALSLQGGAIGVLLLTVFAAYRLYHLLPSGLAFALVLVLVAGAALLAVLQNASALAALGFLGGYLAPVLISTGSGNHVVLFSYYALLNAAVFAIAWYRPWRVLNLIGFVFTFGVGTAWGVKFYRPELFASVEPFLIAFFVFFVAIGVLYVIRQTERRRPWIDGTLVFGTPLLAFPLQAAMLHDNRMALAFSAVAVAGIYAGLVAWLRRRTDLRLLTEAYAALALGFVTLAVPIAFSAAVTSGLWALEGAGAAWIGLRQKRRLTWFAGLLLQLLAGVAYLGHLGLDVFGVVDAPDAMLLINGYWLGAAILAFAGFALSLLHARHRPLPALEIVLFVWACGWWLSGGVLELGRGARAIGMLPFVLAYLGATIALAGVLRGTLRWPRLDWLAALCSGLGLIATFAVAIDRGAPIGADNAGYWLVYLLALGFALWRMRSDPTVATRLAHLVALWTLVALATLQAKDWVDAQADLGDGWLFLALMSPLLLLTSLLWRRPRLFAWPLAAVFDGYRRGWFVPALVLLALAWLVGLFVAGDAAPLPYLPVINPLELTLLASLALLLGYVRARVPGMQDVRRAWALAAFALVSMGVLRAIHHWTAAPWSPAVLDSALTQTALTVTWSLIGVAAWIVGSRKLRRPAWLAGAVLMGVVLVKLVLVDRQYMGDINGVISFIAVGLLMVGVGYFAPSPPKSPTVDSPTVEATA